MFKLFIRNKLENYVKKYFKNHTDVKLVVIAGSVGKTITKITIATVLSEKLRIRMQEGNHNTFFSAPLAILGVDYPENVYGIKAWFEVFQAAKIRISQPSDVDVIIQEIGTDRIGQIPHFGKYLKPDIAVVTAVSPEHMEFLKTIENVAKEELSVTNYSKSSIINRDDIDGKYADLLTNSNINTYGASANAEYYFVDEDFSIKDGYKGQLFAPELKKPISIKVKLFGQHMIKPAVAAGAVALKLGLSEEQIKNGLSKVKPFSGRMNILRGLKNSIIIDDTYNSSPLAVLCSLQTLYGIDAPQRIAVLGSMNELGDSSIAEHKSVGDLCNPAELAWVVTVGDEANKYIAEAAKAKGCRVKICKSALEAGAFVDSVIEPKAAILFKGSQGGIFLEEALKFVLHSTDDEKLLVRQSSYWENVKNTFFESLK